MTSEHFSSRIEEMTQTLHRVTYTQLNRSCDREDAVGACLLKAWEKRNQLKEERFFQTWLIRILLNECHNIQRKNKRIVLAEDIEVAAAIPQTPQDKELRDTLTELEEKLRLPIILHYIEGYSIDEVAKILRLPQGTIKSRMARGRKKLQSMLQEEVFEG
ncbi:MAG: RNA polymerase sigma factor [Clostridiales bacterium]|nr:RNA polymerase sigma factor [Clostridiales bacterium]